MNRTKGEKIFGVINNFLMLLIAVIMIYPVWHVFMYSLSDASKTAAGGIFLYPRGFSFDAYKIVLKTPSILTAYKNTFIVVISATVLNLVLSFLMAYPLTKKDLRGKKQITFFLFFTMIFNGGVVPTYLVVKGTGILNTLWALILPGGASAYYIFILRNFLKTIPESLAESAKIDGASELIILIKIIVPLSKPVMAVLALMYGVGHWNSWFNCIIYMNTMDNYTLQPILRELLFTMNSAEFFENDPSLMMGKSNMPEVTKMATVMVSTIPVVMVYPFLQKYIVHGVMIGAIKG